MADAVDFIRHLMGAMKEEQDWLAGWEKELDMEATRAVARGQQRGVASATAFARGYLRALNDRGEVPAQHQEWVTLTLKK
jgi:hypothetical protein